MLPGLRGKIILAKVVHLTSVHFARDTRIFHHECQSLKKLGYDVVLIAQNKQDEVVDGIKMVSLTRSGSRLKRVLKALPEIYTKALPVYEKQGVGNRFTYYRYHVAKSADGKDAEIFASNMRNNAYTWLDSWLMLDAVMPSKADY